MFSKSRINEPGPKQGEAERPKNQEAPVQKPSTDFCARRAETQAFRLGPVV